MADITMCNDNICPHRTSCYRKLAPINEYRQAFFVYTPREGDVCSYYWPMTDRINRNPKDKENAKAK